MAIESKTLRPGLLVSLKSALTGNIYYSKTMLEPEHVTESGVEKAVWETVRTIIDRPEHDRGRKAQAEARALITKVCLNTTFGLLCPESKTEELTAALFEARKVAIEFNKAARLSKLDVYVITGRIAPDDVEAVKAISNEIQGLMRTMKEGISNMNPKVIRDAANEARKLGSMLAPGSAERVKEAIDVARKAARQINKAGEAAAQEVDKEAMKKLEDCRVAFLDLDGAAEIAAPAEEARAVDFVEEVTTDLKASSEAPKPQIELEEVIAATPAKKPSKKKAKNPSKKAA